MQIYFEGKVTDGGEKFYFGRKKAYFFHERISITKCRQHFS